MKRLLLSFITFAFPALIAFSQVEIKYYPEKDALEHGDFLYGEYVKKHLKEVKLYQGSLVIDGGTLSNVDLVLKAGASLRIINGGIMETRNGFAAPFGATVDIVYGEIL